MSKQRRAIKSLSVFQVDEIIKLIEIKQKSTNQIADKGTRGKIRKLGYYHDDFYPGQKGNFTIDTFQQVLLEGDITISIDTYNTLSLSSEMLWDEINNEHAQSGGIYILKTAKPVNRLLGTDHRGILYIGKANSYVNRVIDLKKSIAPQYNSSAHICGRRYKSNPKIVEAFPYQSLEICLEPTNNPEFIEKVILMHYFREFGESPPLNAFY